MKYYQSLCKRLYRGRYLHEDLFSEFYIKFREFPENKITELKNAGKLLGAGTILIISLFKKRNRNLKTGTTSPLHETAGGIEIYDSIEIVDLPTDKTLSDAMLEKLSGKITECLNDSDKQGDMLFFLQGQEVTLTKLAKEANIPRPYVSAAYNRASRYLKQELTK